MDIQSPTLGLSLQTGQRERVTGMGVCASLPPRRPHTRSGLASDGVHCAEGIGGANSVFCHPEQGWALMLGRL